MADELDNSLALLTQEGLQKQMAFAPKSQLYKDTTEMKARDVEEAQMQILAPSTKIERNRVTSELECWSSKSIRVEELMGESTPMYPSGRPTARMFDLLNVTTTRMQWLRFVML